MAPGPHPSLGKTSGRQQAGERPASNSPPTLQKRTWRPFAPTRTHTALVAGQWFSAPWFFFRSLFPDCLSRLNPVTLCQIGLPRTCRLHVYLLPRVWEAGRAPAVPRAGQRAVAASGSHFSSQSRPHPSPSPVRPVEPLRLTPLPPPKAVTGPAMALTSAGCGWVSRWSSVGRGSYRGCLTLTPCSGPRRRLLDPG